jgi:hypothetical protein
MDIAALLERQYRTFFMCNSEMDLELFLDQLIGGGELSASDRALIVRWQTEAEAGHAQGDRSP